MYPGNGETYRAIFEASGPRIKTVFIPRARNCVFKTARTADNANFGLVEPINRDVLPYKSTHRVFRGCRARMIYATPRRPSA